jgi:hypothetical protein
MSTRGR